MYLAIRRGLNATAPPWPGGSSTTAGDPICSTLRTPHVRHSATRDEGLRRTVPTSMTSGDGGNPLRRAGLPRCEAPVDVLHRTPSFYRQGYRVGKQWYSALRSSVSLGRLDGTGGASDRSTGRTGGASGPSATCPRVCSPSLAQNCATLRISGIRRQVGDDAEVNVDTGLGAAESCRPS
jgi:hypothetical protein